MHRSNMRNNFNPLLNIRKLVMMHRHLDQFGVFFVNEHVTMPKMRAQNNSVIV